MQHTLRNHESLPRRQFHRPIFQIDEQPPFDNVKELVVRIMLVPVVFAPDHPNPNHGIIHLAKRLVVPRMLCPITERFLINHFERRVKHIQPRVI